MAERKPTERTNEPATTPDTGGQPVDTSALEARIAALEAENATLREAADVPAAPSGEARLVWVVTYPRISVQPKGDDGEPLKDKDGQVREPVVLERGAVLPQECEWQAEQLKSFGHVTALSVPA